MVSYFCVKTIGGFVKFDRQKFFDGVKNEFHQGLRQDQVDGLNSLLDNYEKYSGWWDNIDQIANSLGQIRRESAYSFQPVVEGYYLGNPSAAGYFQGNTERVHRFQRSLRYYPDFGRGHIQLTWHDKYVKMDGLIRRYMPEIAQQFEWRTGAKFDLANKPEQALDFDVSFAVMTIGMHQGSFRSGHTLDRYINANVVDHAGARNIVNGDKNYPIKNTNHTVGQELAAHAKKFGSILRQALLLADKPAIEEEANKAPVPVIAPAEAAEVAPTPESVSDGQEMPVLEQNADVIVNQPPVPQKTESEVVVEAASNQPDMEVVTHTNTGLLSKASAFIWAVITGTIILPDWITNGLSGETVKLVFGALYDWRYIIVVVLLIWFIGRKYEAVELKKKQIETNANPKTGNVVLTTHDSMFTKFKNLIGL